MKFYKAFCLAEQSKWQLSINELKQISVSTETVHKLRLKALYNLRKFEQILKEYLQDPNKASNTLKLVAAYSFEKLNMRDSSLKIFKELLSQDINNPELLTCVARLHSSLNSHFEAAQIYRILVQQDQSAETLNKYAVSLINAKQEEKGLSILKQLEAENKANDEILVNLCFYSNSLNSPETEELLQKHKNILQIRLLLIKFLSKEGRIQDCLAEIENAKEKAPEELNSILSKIEDQLKSTEDASQREASSRNVDIVSERPVTIEQRSPREEPPKHDNNLLSVKNLEEQSYNPQKETYPSEQTNPNKQSSLNLVKPTNTAQKDSNMSFKLNISEKSPSDRRHSLANSNKDQEDNKLPEIRSPTKQSSLKISSNRSNPVSDAVKEFENQNYAKAVSIFDSSKAEMGTNTNRIFIDCCEKAENYSKAIERLEVELEKQGYSNELALSVIRNAANMDNQEKLKTYTALYTENNENTEELIELLMKHKNCTKTALSLLEKVNDIDMKSHFCAKMALQNNKNEEAVKLMEQIAESGKLKTVPKFSKTYGKALSRQGDIKKATKFFKYALKKDLTDYDAAVSISESYLKLDNLKGAEKYLDFIPKQSFNLRVYFSMGRLHYRKKKFEEAKKFFKICLEHDEKNSKVHHNLAMISLETGEKEEAEGFLRRAIEIEPDFYPSNYELFCLLADFGKKEEAQNLLETVENKLEHHNAANFILVLAGKLGETDKALKIFKEREFKKEEGENLSFALGNHLFEAGRASEAAELLANCTEMLEKSLFKAKVYLKCLIKCDKIEEADLFLRRIKDTGDQSEYYLMKARICFHKGEYGKGVSLAAQLLERDEENEDAIAISALCNMKLKKFDRAISLISNCENESERLNLLELVVSREAGYDENFEELKNKLRDSEKAKELEQNNFDLSGLI